MLNQQELSTKLLKKIKYKPKYDSRLLRIKIIDSVDRYLKYILSEFDDYEKELKRKSNKK
jgi:hypothetical protein